MSFDQQAYAAALAAAPPPLIQSGHLHIKRCRFGLMLYSARDVYIGRAIDLYGELGEYEISIFRQLVKPGQTVFDIGANIGAHALALASLVGPHGHVGAFEPQRVIFQIMNANMALNGLHHVKTYQTALGSTAGSIKVPPLNYAAEFNFGGVELDKVREGEEVPMVTFDSLAVPACHFAKIDVEGMELEVLKGMADTMRRCRPAMYVENDRAHKFAALVAHFLGLDYRLYYHPTPIFAETNFFANPVNVYGGTATFNMICLPRERGQEVRGMHEITDPNEKLLPTPRTA